ncbi:MULTISPECIES: MarR family winged helix-turn-helix transcriptional regulator [Miniimonas]|nr:MULTISPECIES: MarR family transcriptional regulator [Miniimonas]
MPAQSSGQPRQPRETNAELVSNLRRAVLMTSRRLRAERAGGVTESQYSVLAHLSCEGECTPSDLAELECVSAPSMTRTVAALETAGLVERRPHPDDGRQVLVRISDEGTAVIAATRRRRNAWLTQRLGALSPDERDALARAADILRRISAR